MFITRYKLDDSVDHVKLCLENAGFMHKYTWQFFKDMTDFEVCRQSVELLYSVKKHHNDIILVLTSNVRPNNAPEGATLVRCVDTEGMENKVKNLGSVRFIISAAPTCKPNGKRVFIQEEEGRLNWLKRRMAYIGAEATNVRELSTHLNKVTKGSNNFYFSSSVFTGTLNVKDFDKFFEGFYKGIGAEKAYGMGLIQFI